ncbi:hypothetical protein JOD54_002010 [Actinokineospora baliensis]|uniref:tachylectin-related carbohydrate-binding protein n=1 Tax=Actinokineospora baliensis TaxID=547056 RepID=UPI00195827BD|nr:tachylectin-related carbohydrate-binding protein [Actinokineospora baliensis]MBM7771806.1 hypothetical protein [Actinokineospora baliensis]
MSVTKYAATLLTALTLASGLTLTAAAQPGSVLCESQADVFGFEADGDLFTYPHKTPLEGTSSWGAKRYIGTGWHEDYTVAGPDGTFFTIDVLSDELRRYQWTGDRWQTFAYGRQYEVVGRGFARYVHSGGIVAAFDSSFQLYVRDGDLLRLYAWSLSQNRFTPETAEGPVIGSGWTGVDKIVGAGSGVVYASLAGGLYRSQYDSAARRWVTSFERVGTGWDVMGSIASPGADILYATFANSGDLYEYRYNPVSHKWLNDKGSRIGHGWAGISLQADPSACFTR